jgi:hypothetical protein
VPISFLMTLDECLARSTPIQPEKSELMVTRHSKTLMVRSMSEAFLESKQVVEHCWRTELLTFDP